jgi:ribosomal protein S27AE
VSPCPKCGYFAIGGPFYEKHEHGERLRYRCGRCGYSFTTPTEDAKKRMLEAARRPPKETP